MGALVGFALGYALGAKAGPEGYQKLGEAWQSIANSGEFKTLLASITGLVPNVMEKGLGAVAEPLQSLVKGNGGLKDAWKSIVESEQFQSLTSRGMTLMGGVLEQGKTLFNERLNGHSRAA